MNIKFLPNAKDCLFIGFSFALGLFALASIQVFINMYHSNIFSLAPNGGQVYHAGVSLNIFQLNTGLQVNFYETSVVEGEMHGFRYINQTGKLILDIEGSIYSYSDYMRLLLKYPFEMIGMWMRSILMGLNPISGGGIILNRNGRFTLTLANFTMLFLLVSYIKRSIIDLKLKDFNIILKQKSIEFKNSVMSLMTIVLPIIFIIPGAVEERFLIGFWVLVYGLFLYVINIRQELRSMKKRKYYNLSLYILFFFIFTAILTELYANNNSGVFLPLLSLNRWW